MALPFPFSSRPETAPFPTDNADTPTTPGPDGDVRISPRHIVGFGSALAALLLLVALMGHLLLRGSVYEVPGFEQLFNVDGEGNFPTWYASLLLLANAVAMLILSRRELDPSRCRSWMLLGLLFVLLSAEEIANLHNAPTPRLRPLLGDAGGFLTNAWVVPGALFAGAVGLFFLRFLRQLPRRVSTGMMLAGGLYLIGALVLEVISGKIEFHQGTDTYTYSLAFELTAIAEEVFEYGGTLLLLWVLLQHLTTLGARLQISFGPAAPEKTKEEAPPLLKAG